MNSEQIKILRPVWVEIDLDNIKHNFKEIRKFLDYKTKLGCVIKADAYGHGSLEISKLLEDEGSDYFCVAGLDEAMELRLSGIKSDILVMGYIATENFDIAIENNISITIFSKKQAIELSNIAEEINKIAKIHIKIETGFNRLGFKINDDLVSIIESMNKLSNVFIEGIFSHLALTDYTSDYKQIYKFNRLLSQIKHINIPIKHICDSIGMIEYRDSHMDMVRVGASLYGYNSRENNLNLKPSITFKSIISTINYIEKGEGIGYDYTFVANKDMKIGTVTCGYGDGIPRILSNKGYVYVNGKKANIIGKICMDQCIVDLTDIDEVKVEDEVIFYGECGPTLLEVANIANTNRNEILSLISKRVKKVYIKDKKYIK